MMVVGLGFRRAVTPDEIVGLVYRALDDAGLARAELRRLATAESRASEPGLLEAARILGLDVEAVAADRLAAADARIATRAERILALHGVGSVAEAAALCAAGPGARLVLPRISVPRATCAMAAELGA